MEKQIFLNIFKHQYLRTNIFEKVRYIHIDILKLKSYKYRDILNNAVILSAYNYLGLLKQCLAKIENNELQQGETINLNHLIYGIFEVAIKEGHLAIVEFLVNKSSSFTSTINITHVMSIAAQHGHLHILKYLDSISPRKYNMKTKAYDAIFIKAARSGNLILMEWLLNKVNEYDKPKEDYIRLMAKRAMSVASTTGNIATMEWLMQKSGINELSRFDSNMILKAIHGGQLEMLKWLADKGVDLPSTSETQIIDLVSSLGNLDILTFFFHQHHGTESGICTHRAMDEAAKNGHLEVVKWLHHNRKEGCSIQAMDNAARYGHLEVIKWLHKNRTEGCTTEAMDSAGNFEVLKWLHYNRTEGCTQNAGNNACAQSLEIVKWINENRTEGFSQHAVILACTSKKYDIVKYLYDNVKQNFMYAESVFFSQMKNEIMDNNIDSLRLMLEIDQISWKSLFKNSYNDLIKVAKKNSDIRNLLISHKKKIDIELQSNGNNNNNNKSFLSKLFQSKSKKNFDSDVIN